MKRPTAETILESNSILRRRCIEAEAEVAVLRSRLEQADKDNAELRRQLKPIMPVLEKCKPKESHVV